ncbi:ribonuclease HII [Methylophilus medardicus]|uniref:Ribonuclease HII n=1 Tax=Methylophilus medardicus TaxID=2588534 RepID=A0A5B8CRI0_9PROT|nr:ribonuclease HII [Methylophilus medardicus]QDC43867.1 ribonuclease HII [Methylophilus medardicus]QDC48874.1 ribonuclease HII [Methylophilus medardicus]QDC52579.1 ribonuclease HII [Methylophilus medardicus]
MQRLCGIDEAGRGPLAGAVYAAAVILDPERPIAGLADSKKLSEAKRDALAVEIKSHAWAWGIASVSAQEIDQINILQASLLAMQRAYQHMIDQFGRHATLIQVDGNRCPIFSVPCEAIVKGDSKVAEISAASILAKTARDASLLVLDRQYPHYGFAQHKGYPTALHLARLAQYGITPAHRRSYAPVKKYLVADCE